MVDVINTADKLACAKRELALRERNYPRWADEKRMSAGRATHEIECMKAIVADYERLVTAEFEEVEPRLPL